MFAAIRRANPGGLGRAGRHDVAGASPPSLRDAMAEAASRDAIARAYVTGFAEIDRIGRPALAAARAAGREATWCTTSVHLAYLSDLPDSHVLRKHGPDIAEAVRREAQALSARIEPGPAAVEPLLAFDRSLKARGINPGTSADLTVATLFADALDAAKGA